MLDHCPHLSCAAAPAAAGSPSPLQGGPPGPPPAGVVQNESKAVHYNLCTARADLSHLTGQGAVRGTAASGGCRSAAAAMLAPPSKAPCARLACVKSNLPASNARRENSPASAGRRPSAWCNAAAATGCISCAQPTCLDEQVELLSNRGLHSCVTEGSHCRTDTPVCKHRLPPQPTCSASRSARTTAGPPCTCSSAQSSPAVG